MKINLLGMGYLGQAYGAWLGCGATQIRCIGPKVEPAPDLRDVFGQVEQQGNLTFGEFDPKADLLWVTIDTPIDAAGNADVDAVISAIHGLWIPVEMPIVISSQIPVGTTARLEGDYPQNQIAYSPENVRVGRALDYLFDLDRLILGTRHDSFMGIMRRIDVLAKEEILCMSPESAEMVKHATNGLLGCCIAYINEIGDICNQVGANPKDVSLGLSSEGRIGPRLPLKPGGPFQSGHLERDLIYLANLGNDSVLIRAITASNNARKQA